MDEYDEQEKSALSHNWKCSLFYAFLLFFLLTGCQLTPSALSKTTGNAGSAFAAAATTLAYAHEGNITYAYARSSFENYQSELSGLDQQLSAQSSPDTKNTIQHLLALYRPAMQAVNQPCLEASCNWRAQVNALNAASQAFLKASGS